LPVNQANHSFLIYCETINHHQLTLLTKMSVSYLILIAMHGLDDHSAAVGGSDDFDGGAICAKQLGILAAFGAAGIKPQHSSEGK
jgi:hypothetical protein